MGERTSRTLDGLLLRVEKTSDGCWVWTGARSTAGYGHVKVDGVYRDTHRLVYELAVGPIPTGLQLDHLCRNPPCCNPEHLEPVTPSENIRRGTSPLAENARKTSCVNGHPFDEKNTRIEPLGRRCRACDREMQHRKRDRARQTEPALTPVTQGWVSGRNVWHRKETCAGPAPRPMPYQRARDAGASLCGVCCPRWWRGSER